MLYAFALIAAVSFASGFGLSHKIDKAQIQHIQDGIAAQNMEATLALKSLTEQVSAYATLCKNYIDTLRELDYVKRE